MAGKPDTPPEGQGPQKDHARAQARSGTQGDNRRSAADAITDKGDGRGTSASPYDNEVQADAVAKQTRRKDAPHGIEKPRRQ